VIRKTDDRENRISFQVQDNGIGMSLDQLGVIFDGYSMSSRNKDHQMTGLGLYITQHFSRMMGGEIGVESQLSKGSTFSISLPSEVKPTT